MSTGTTPCPGASDGWRPEARKGRSADYAKLIESIYDAVFVVGPDGAILDFNERALDYFRIEPQALQGRQIGALFPGSAHSPIEELCRSLVGHRHAVVESRCLRGDGTAFHGEIAVSRPDFGGGELCFLVRDISVRHKAQQDLQHALERMEAVNRARMEFVSNVSHELRTPLTSMIYAVRNMQNGNAGALGERALQYLARLDSDCRRLLGTVNDILDLRQIENNTLVLARTKTALASVAESAVESLRVQADARGIALSAAVEPPVEFVECDRRKMERVFINVIGNALKFTPAEGAVSIRTGRSADFPSMVVFEVSDTGIGIPPEALPKVTARYFQVGDQPVGTGLGLAIAKEIVELHGGRLAIQSPVPGTAAGTRVTVALPSAPAPCLLVVAGAATRGAVPSALDAYGIPDARLASGHAAIRHCTERPPDALALCGDTDDLPACDVVAKLRNDRRTARLPILYVDDGADRAPDARRGVLAVMAAFKAKTLPADAAPRALAAALLSLLP